MKRILICAAAAIVALASCSKTQVVYNDAPEEIGFKAVTGVMTKAPNPATSALTGDMGVFAYQGSSLYFDNTDFEKRNEETYWTAETPKYWPVSGDLTFTVYSPYDANVKYYDIAHASDPVVNAKTLYIVENDGTITDWLYGTSQPTGNKNSEKVDVSLAHALAYIDINVTGETAIKLKGIELLSTNQKGICKIEYSTPVTVTWTPTETVASIELYTPTDNVNGDALSNVAKNVYHLVVPTAELVNEAVRLTYRMDGMEETAPDLVYETKVKVADPATANDLGTAWSNGKKYVYNINIGVNEIEFNPVVVGWDANTEIDGAAADEADDAKTITID